MGQATEHRDVGRLGLWETVLGLTAEISPRGWEIIVGLAAPLLLLGALLSGEGLLRLEQIRAFGADQVFEPGERQSAFETVNGRRRLRPGAEMGRIHFTSAGFRGDELAMPKPQGLIRVGFFGASTTLDPYVAEDEAMWSAVAVSRLKARFPACRFDFFNAGVAGYNIAASGARLVEDAARFEPDIAVFLLNDISGRSRDQLVARGIEAEAYRRSWFANQSLLWWKLEKNIAAERYKRIAARKDVSHRLDLDAMMDGVRSDLRDLLDSTIGMGVTAVLIGNASRMRREQPLSTQVDNAISRVLVMPNVFIGDMTESYYRYNAELRDAAAKYGIPYVETIDKMPASAAYYVDSVHTTRLGSGVFGEIVGGALAAHPAIVSVVTRRCGAQA